MLRFLKKKESNRRFIERSIEAMHTYQDVLVGYSDLEYQKEEKRA